MSYSTWPVAGNPSIVRSQQRDCVVLPCLARSSTTSTALPGLLKSATVVRVPTIERVNAMLKDRTLDAFATNKSILFEISDGLPGSKVLDGRYGLEQLALGIPKGRESGLPYARSFVAAAVSSGLVKAAIARAGLRGTLQ